MLQFSSFLTEEKAKPADFGKLDNNTKGVLHELLVGKSLMGGQHMAKHPDVKGLSPKEAHDELAKQLGGEKSHVYKNFKDRAEKAAEDILNKKGMTRNDISNVQWTSKEGDMKRATGIDATQNEDDSDIVVTDKSGRHHGISLKVSDDNKPITLSNGGEEATYGGKKFLDAHRQGILASYPEINNLKGDPKALKNAINRKVQMAAAKGKILDPKTVKIGADDLRKGWLYTNKKAATDINQRTKTMLQNVVGNMHNELKKMKQEDPKKLGEHVRHLVVHAYSTPKEAQGHTHMRHFTGGGFKPAMHAQSPGTDYEHYLAHPENIHPRVSGANIYYDYEHHDETGKKHMIPFAMQTAKLGTASDPLSSLTILGRDVKRAQDEGHKENIKAAYEKEKAATGKDLRQVAPDQEISSKHIQQDHPILRQKKLLSDVRPAVPSQQRRVAQTGSPFQSMARPGIKPGSSYREHTDNTHGGFQF